jgi:RNA polymerase sigma-70 factor (ECF subfamily)
MGRTEELEQAIGVHLARQDWHGAATAIMNGYGRAVLRYIRAILPDEDAAAEVFAQFSENLWAGIAGFRAQSSVRTWVYRLAWHASLDFLRDGFRRRTRRLETSEFSDLADEIRSSTPFFLTDDARGKLEQLARKLEPGDRALLILRVSKKLPWRQVCEVLSTDAEPLTEDAAKMRFGRMTKRLRGMAEVAGLLPLEE